jgi:hypothetical protein
MRLARASLSLADLATIREGNMPRCYFDLRGKSFELDQHGLECGSIANAIDKANVLASGLGKTRPELLDVEHYISVIEESGREIHQAPVSKAVVA